MDEVELNGQIFINASDFAKHFGVSREAISKKIKKGQIKASKITRTVYAIPKDEINKWKIKITAKYNRIVRV